MHGSPYLVKIFSYLVHSPHRLVQITSILMPFYPNMYGIDLYFVTKDLQYYQRISVLGSNIAISGCPSLSQSFWDTIKLAIIQNVDFVTLITIILIFYPFYHVIVNMSLKFRQFKKSTRAWRHAYSSFRCTDWRRDWCILYPVHIQLEINMHHLPKAMQYRQALWAILTKICFFLIDS